RGGTRIWLGTLGVSVSGRAASGAGFAALRISIVSSVAIGLGRGGTAFLGAATALLRTCTGAAALTRSAGLRTAAVLRTAGRLAAFLPFAAFGAGFLAGISCSSSKRVPREGRGIIPADPGVYSAVPGVPPTGARLSGTLTGGCGSPRRGGRRERGTGAPWTPESRSPAYGRGTWGGGFHPGCRRSTTTLV